MDIAGWANDGHFTDAKPVKISSLRIWNLKKEGLVERKTKKTPPETLTRDLRSFPQAHVIQGAEGASLQRKRKRRGKQKPKETEVRTREDPRNFLLPGSCPFQLQPCT